MPSFHILGGPFPASYVRATTAWLLRERRDVVARIQTIEAELARIGLVRMVYQTYEEGETVKASERRIGFTVSKGTTLAKLMQSYIAQGGNPFNISGFLIPDESVWEEDINGELVLRERYPNSGVVSPKSTDYNAPSTTGEGTGYETYDGGFSESYRYMPARMGGRIDRGAWDNATVVRIMHDTRKWANATIARRLQDAEWRIIKLFDLHEQLRSERDDHLLEAFAGQLDSLDVLDEEKYDPQRLCQVLISDLYALLYESSTTPSAARKPETGFLYFVVSDLPEDDMGPMG